VRDRIAAGEDVRVRGQGHDVLGPRLRESHALPGQPVDPGRLRARAAVGSERVRAQRIHGDEEHVQAGLAPHARAARVEGETNGKAGGESEGAGHGHSNDNSNRAFFAPFIALNPMIPALLLVFTAASPPDGASSLPRGQVVESLHGAETDQTYALYLPTSYDAARPAPIVYLLDARGRALVPLERFRAGAESLGVVLASSYRSRSDEPTDPNGPAVRAMWVDTYDRLKLDEHRAFLAGFSGTARISGALAAATKGALAGVIASGAGFPAGLAPARGLGFLYFAGVGDEDFNHDEVRRLDRRLFDLDYPYRYEVYPGPHDWMP